MRRCVGEPPVIGEALYFLATNKFTTGVVLDVDGGHQVSVCLYCLCDGRKIKCVYTYICVCIYILMMYYMHASMKQGVRVCVTLHVCVLMRVDMLMSRCLRRCGNTP